MCDVPPYGQVMSIIKIRRSELITKSGFSGRSVSRTFELSARSSAFLMVLAMSSRVIDTILSCLAMISALLYPHEFRM